MYEIEFTPDAFKDLRSLRKNAQQEILGGIATHLKHQPTVETRQITKLRKNDVADWELRLGKYRVFYNVFEEVQIVRIEAVGVKERNRLFVRGKRTDL